MARIRGKGTKPELGVRRLCHAMGYRFRIHRRDLPGTPDVVFPARRKVILVHGCWWHRHHCRLGRRTPKSRPEYWLPKFSRNVARDKENRRALRRLGWSVLVIWECQVRQETRLAARVRRFLDR
jgi:DNA mismatch endonuclease (patch repair protein)